MSGAPGWYADPDGVPGLQRWWSGTGWSELTQGGPTYTGPAGYGSAPYGSVAAPPRPPPDVIGSPERRTRPGWLPGALLGGAVLLIIVLAVTLLSWGSEGGRPPIGDPGIPTAPTDTGPENTFPPGTVRIIDPDAGISYAYLGEGWREVAFDPRPEMITTHGQYIVTQETVPDGGTFIAEASSGPLAPQFAVTGPADFAAVIDAVSESFRANYYPAPNEKDVLSSEPVTIDGRQGHLLSFDLTWDVAGYDSTGERVALLLLDTGRERPAVMYISIPNTHAELYGIIDQLVASIQLL